MIKLFRHKGLQAFFEKGSKAGIQPHHADKLNRQLAALNQAAMPEQMDIPGWRLHSLSGGLNGHWSVWTNVKLAVDLYVRWSRCRVGQLSGLPLDYLKVDDDYAQPYSPWPDHS